MMELFVRWPDGSYRPFTGYMPPAVVQLGLSLYVKDRQKIIWIGELTDDGRAVFDAVPSVKHCRSIRVRVYLRPSPAKPAAWRVGKLCKNGVHLDRRAIDIWVRARMGDPVAINAVLENLSPL